MVEGVIGQDLSNWRQSPSSLTASYRKLRGISYVLNLCCWDFLNLADGLDSGKDFWEGCLYRKASRSTENNLQRGTAFRRKKEEDLFSMGLKHLQIAKRRGRLGVEEVLKTPLLSRRQ